MSFANRISDDYRPCPPICRRCREPKSMFGVNLLGICWECLRQTRNKRLREPIRAEVREVMQFLPSER